MNVFDLAAKLTLDTSEYEQGLNSASTQATSFGSKVKSGLGTAAKVGATALVAVGAAATKLTSSIISGTSEVSEYGDHIDKMSQKLGISAEAYQEWDAVMQHSGTSIDSMQAGMKTLASAAETGNEAFEKLGITQEQIASMSQEELFGETITALQNVEDETERTYLAGQLLGRGATELGALLNTSAEETQAMKDRVHELGGVMSNEAVKAAAAYQDSLQDLQTAVNGLKNKLFSEFMPGITTVMDGLTELFTGGGTEKITEGIGMITDKITEMMPQVMSVASDIIMSLADALLENLPALADTAIQVIVELATYLISNLDKIVDVALQIILALADGIGEALPTLIPALVDVILAIVDKLTEPETISQMIDAAVAIIEGLISGISAAIPRVIEKAPEIILNLITALIECTPQLLEAGVQLLGSIGDGILSALGSIGEIGKNIVEGLWEGIKSLAGWLWDKVSGWIGDIWDGICEFFGIASPSKEMAWIGKMMSKGLADGIEKNSGLAVDAATDMCNDISGAFDNADLVADTVKSAFDIEPTIAGATGYGGVGEEIIVPRSGDSANSGTATAILEIDRVQFAKLIYRLNNEESGRVGVKLAEVT